MEFKKVLAVAKKKKHFVIMENKENNRFLSVGAAIYCVDGLMIKTKDEIRFLCDIKPDDDEWWYEVSEETAESLKNEDENEIILKEPLKTKICFDYKYVAFEIGEEIVFINSEYLKPFSKDKEINFTARVYRENRYVVCVKKGFLLMAMIYPAEFISSHIVCTEIKKYHEYFLKCAKNESEYEQQKLFQE